MVTEGTLDTGRGVKNSGTVVRPTSWASFPTDPVGNPASRSHEYALRATRLRVGGRHTSGTLGITVTPTPRIPLVCRPPTREAFLELLMPSAGRRDWLS